METEVQQGEQSENSQPEEIKMVDGQPAKAGCFYI